jgi:hypothetical protein
MQCITPGSRLNGHDSENDGEEGVTAPLKLTNVPSVTVRMKSYPERDLENDGEEGVATEINKQTWCDLRDFKQRQGLTFWII